MGDGGAGASGGNLSGEEASILGLNAADTGVTPAGNPPSGFGGGTGEYGGNVIAGAEIGEQGVGTGGVMDTSGKVPTGGSVIKGGEAPKVEEAKKAIKRSTRRRTLLSDEEGGLEPVPIYRRSILGS